MAHPEQVRSAGYSSVCSERVLPALDSCGRQREPADGGPHLWGIEFKVHHGSRRSDRRVQGLVREGMAGVWAWTSRAMWSMVGRMYSLSGGSVSDAVVLCGTREGAASFAVRS